MTAPPYLRFQTRSGGCALVLAGTADVPCPWARFGYLVHHGRGYEPCLWTQEGYFRDDHAQHPHDILHNQGEARIDGPIALHL